MTPEAFRALFPALATSVWLDTPGSPPGALPVVNAQKDALNAWLDGSFSWLDWDRAPAECRSLFAEWVGVPTENVALVGSVAEAAAIVAATLPPGRVVVAADEFRSNLFPWLSLDPARHEVVVVPMREGLSRSDALVETIDGATVLLAVSEVLSHDGLRADLLGLRRATDAVGARLFVDATQSLGALHIDVGAVQPDYLAVHGYKWMLCPRGAAWLVARSDRHDELRPLMPSWKSTPEPHRYFGGPFELAAGAARCDTSPAWFSWIGAVAALRLHLKLDPLAVERYCIALATTFIERAKAAGAELVTPADSPSHIAVVRVDEPEAGRARLNRHAVRATILGDRLRVGFHYFNDNTDVETALDALAT